MGGLLSRLFTFFLGNMIARVLTGAGMTLITVSWLGDLVNSQVQQVSASFNGVSGVFAQMLALSGVFQAVGYVLTAIVARVAIDAASNVLGVMRK
ncbi:DUF2523 family protein [Pseudomonas knackmussii]|uniref:DUF2523 family protein n=1 Tax=Pseudomonas knackmussii TaxID=65741 RepID=UPI003BC01985